MAHVVVPSVEMRAILAGLGAGCSGGSGSSSSSGGTCTGRLCNLTLRLFANDFTPSITSAWGDVVEADFQGYQNFTPVTWSLPFTDILGISKLFGGCHLFGGTGPANPNTIFGWALTRADGGTVLVAALRFDTPVSITGDAQVVIAEPYFPLTTPA